MQTHNFAWTIVHVRGLAPFDRTCHKLLSHSLRIAANFLRWHGPVRIAVINGPVVAEEPKLVLMRHSAEEGAAQVTRRLPADYRPLPLVLWAPEVLCGPSSDLHCEGSLLMSTRSGLNNCQSPSNCQFFLRDACCLHRSCSSSRLWSRIRGLSRSSSYSDARLCWSCNLSA